MIRYKDKVFEEWNIDPATGIITDALTGEVQETPIYRGRAHFKRMRVHVIQAWTHLPEMAEGMDVHYIDGNPANDSVENLKIMTHADHAALHSSQRTGWHFSEETRQKMSRNRKGKCTKAPGWAHTEETRRRMSKLAKEKVWWHDSAGNTAHRKECPGPGWSPGRKVC